MIKKSLITCILFFILYSIFLYIFPVEGFTNSQYQDNIVKVENYLFSTNTCKKVIIGSSLSFRLISDSLPGFFNLSLGGLSIFDGLEIIIKTGKYPDVLYIETNVLDRTADESFIDAINNPVMFFLKSHLLAFRQNKKSLAIVAGNIIRVIKGKPENYTAKNSKLNHEILDLQIKNASVLPDTSKIKKNIACLKQEIDLLENAGVNIVFFQMPVHPDIKNSVKYSFIQKSIHQNFNTNEYKFVPEKNWNFETTDGLHLNKKEASIFSRFLFEYDQQHQTTELDEKNI